MAEQTLRAEKQPAQKIKTREAPGRQPPTNCGLKQKNSDKSTRLTLATLHDRTTKRKQQNYQLPSNHFRPAKEKSYGASRSPNHWPEVSGSLLKGPQELYSARLKSPQKT